MIYDAPTSNPGMAKKPIAQPGTPPPSAPPAEDLFSIMKRRMDEVQNGRPDPGNGGNAPQPTDPNEHISQEDPGYQALPPNGGNGTGYSTTPMAAPTGPTTNQGGQDAWRNALIAQMTQSEVPNVNDPSIKSQLEPFAAAQERARREEVRRGAEEAFAGQQDYGTPEKMAAAERAGQNTGLMASDLVGRELTARRAQISDALHTFGSQISEDQRQALQMQLAQLDAQLRREGMAQTGNLGGRDLDLRDKLGTGGLNVELIRALFNNDQFAKDLGFRIGDAEQGWNNQALLRLMGR